MFIQVPTNDYCHTLILQSNKNLTLRRPSRIRKNKWILLSNKNLTLRRPSRAAAQCEIHIQQKFFPNAVQLEFNGQKIVVKVLLFELSFSSNEQKLVQKLFFCSLSYWPTLVSSCCLEKQMLNSYFEYVLWARKNISIVSKVVVGKTYMEYGEWGNFVEILYV
jgi:hypothetical protein